jgi:predicted ATP-dependent serine protease
MPTLGAYKAFAKTFNNKPMGKTISLKTLLNNEYPLLGVSEEVRNHLGDLERGFTMLIYGESGSGKTTYALGYLAPYLAAYHGKVYYNSKENGEGSAVQHVLKHSRMAAHVPEGRMYFGDRDNYEEMLNKIKGLRPSFIFIDSLDYMNLTQQQYKHLEALCHKGPKRYWSSLIVISWSQGGKPKSQHGKAIEYMVDVKVTVERGTLRAKSRYGATQPYTIFATKTAQTSIF